MGRGNEHRNRQRQFGGQPADPWGDYAAPNAPAIRRMDDLPSHVASRFAVRAAEDTVGT